MEAATISSKVRRSFRELEMEPEPNPVSSLRCTEENQFVSLGSNIHRSLRSPLRRWPRRSSTRRQSMLATGTTKLLKTNVFNFRKVFLHTIALARQMRPYARWGFYGFPYCNYDAGNSETDMLCSEKFRKYNDEYVLLLTFFVFSKEFHIYIYRMFCSDKLRQLNNEIGCNTALLT